MTNKIQILTEKLKKIKTLQEELHKGMAANNEGGYYIEGEFPTSAYDRFINFFEGKHSRSEDVKLNKQWKKVLVQMLTHPKISPDQESRALNSTCPHIAGVAKTTLAAKTTTSAPEEQASQNRQELEKDKNIFQKHGISEKKHSFAPQKRPKEELDKVRWVNGKPYPEDGDAGKPHPTDEEKVGHQTADSRKNVWSHKPELVEYHKQEILKNFNKLNLSPAGKKNMVGLMTHLWDDPDAGVMVSGTTPNADRDFSEVRVRHLHNAVKGKFGYNIKEQKNGNIQIHAPRHSKGKNTETAKTVWTWDGNTLKSEHKDPIGNTLAQGEYTYGQAKQKKQ